MARQQHSHKHSHPEITGKNLLISIVLNIGITFAQVIGGLISGSLALLSDALHNFTDVVSLVISYMAHRFSKKDASYTKTYGYKRAEILAAFVNAATLLVIAILLIIEAVQRFFDPQEIEAGLVIWLALLAIAGNGFSVFLLRKDKKRNINMRSAYLHLLIDTLASVAVLIGGLLMHYFQWFWVDPVLTFGIAVYLIVAGYDLLKASFQVLMHFSPELSIDDLVKSISTIPAVKNVHHLHVWQLNEKETQMEAHIDFYENIRLSEFEEVLKKIKTLVHEEFGIDHLNIQPEYTISDNKDVIVQH